MAATSSRRARPDGDRGNPAHDAPVQLSAPAQGRAPARPRRSSAAPRHSRRGESRPHAPAGYRPAARRRRAKPVSPTRNRVAASWLLHPRQRGIAALDLVGIEIGGGFAEIEHLEAAHRDIGLVAVLLPEQPFIHLRRGEGVGGNEVAAAGEIADDGVGLRQRAAVVEFDHRHLAGAVELEELRRAGLALERSRSRSSHRAARAGRRPTSPSGNCRNCCRRRSSSLAPIPATGTAAEQAPHVASRSDGGDQNLQARLELVAEAGAHGVPDGGVAGSP